MTPTPDDDDSHRMTKGFTGSVFGAAIWVALGGWLWGCAPSGGLSAQGQKTVDILCERDAALQPIVVPVVAVAAPASGPAAPMVAGAIAADMLLIHPSVVAACAQYGSKPAGVVAAVPAGATVAPAVIVATP